MKQISRTAANAQSQNPTTEQIALAAYHLYVQNGCQDGHGLDDWLSAEKLLRQKVEEVSQIQVTEPARKAASQAVEIRPAEARENPPARIERGPASREETRQKLTPSRPASRRPQWRAERPIQTRRAA